MEMKLVPSVDKNDHPTLARFNDDHPHGEVMHLYEVEVYDPINKRFLPKIHVLAENWQGALSQATANTDLESYKAGPLAYKKIEEVSHVQHRPLLIRGWGRSHF